MSFGSRCPTEQGSQSIQFSTHLGRHLWLAVADDHNQPLRATHDAVTVMIVTVENPVSNDECNFRGDPATHGYR